MAQSVASQTRSASGTQLDLLHSVWKLTKAEQAAGVGALSACVHGYSRQPEMATLSNAIHLLLADSCSRAYFLHVPGKANCADIPSRVPFIANGNTMELDPTRLSVSDARTVAALNAFFLPTMFPSASQLADLSTFWSRS